MKTITFTISDSDSSSCSSQLDAMERNATFQKAKIMLEFNYGKKVSVEKKVHYIKRTKVMRKLLEEPILEYVDNWEVSLGGTFEEAGGAEQLIGGGEQKVGI